LVLHTIDVIQIMLIGVVGRPRRRKGVEQGKAGPPERGSLRWEIMRREKFFWKADDLRLGHPVKDKDAPGRASDDPREDDEGRPGTGRG
jgi:hypothetical protein